MPEPTGNAAFDAARAGGIVDTFLSFPDVKAAKAGALVKGLADDEAFGKIAKLAEAKIESWDFRTHTIAFGADYPFLPNWKELAFFKGQVVGG